MANYILNNDIDILRCANWAMDLILTSLKEAARLEGMEQNPILNGFLEKLDQECYGRGSVYVDISEYFDQEASVKKLPFALLYKLVGIAIDRIKRDAKLDPRFIVKLEEFKERIVS